jgi:hypothetical protein
MAERVGQQEIIGFRRGKHEPANFYSLPLVVSEQLRRPRVAHLFAGCWRKVGGIAMIAPTQAISS